MTERPPKDTSRFQAVLLKALTALALAGLAAFAATTFLHHKTHPAPFAALSAVFRSTFLVVAAALAVYRAVDLLRSRTWRRLGGWSYLPGAVLVLVLLYGAVRLPFAFRRDITVEQNQAAQSAGARAELAMKRFFAEHKRYTGDLDALLKIDPGIAQSPEVTFHFDLADESGYRFTTHFSNSRLTYRFSSKGVLLFKGAPVRAADHGGDE